MWVTRIVRTIVISAFLLGSASGARAQTAAGDTPFSGQGLVTQRVLSLDMAEAIARGVVEQCRADGFSVSVAVIDASGEVKAFLRDEGTGPHTVEFSRGKAYAALTLQNRWPTTLAAANERGYLLGSPPTNVPGAILLGGGVPIRVGSEPIGAVGVSGAVGGDKDEICANAGIARVAHLLH